jgi:hypothetical protein
MVEKGIGSPSMKLVSGCLFLSVLFAGNCAFSEEPTEHDPHDPGAVVAESVDAYNRQHFEAFAATLHPDVRLYEIPNKLLYSSPSEALAAYGQLFKEAKNLRADVSSRLVQGEYVVDQETIHGMPGRSPTTGIAIYKVVEGKIVAIWFLE